MLVPSFQGLHLPAQCHRCADTVGCILQTSFDCILWSFGPPYKLHSTILKVLVRMIAPGAAAQEPS